MVEGFLSRHLKGTYRVRLRKAVFWKYVYQVDTKNGPCILKASYADPCASAVYREWQAFRLLRRHSLELVPEVMRYERLRGVDFILQRFIPAVPVHDPAVLARSVGEYHAIKGRSRRVDGMEFARGVLADISLAFSYGSASDADARLPGLIDAALTRAAAKIAAAKKYLRRPVASVFINGDLDHDFFTQQGRIYIIDWHTSGYGDPAWDVARICGAYPLAAAGFLKAYRTPAADPYFMERVKVYSDLNRLLTVAGSFFQPRAPVTGVVLKGLSEYL